MNDTAQEISTNDELVFRLLRDPRYRVTDDGQVLTNLPRSGGRPNEAQPWRRAGWLTPSRSETGLYYRRVRYEGVCLYEHRIVCAVKYGFLNPCHAVDHLDGNGLNNHPDNLVQRPPYENVQRSVEIYRRRGMSAAEARANWIRGGQPAPAIPRDKAP